MAQTRLKPKAKKDKKSWQKRNASREPKQQAAATAKSIAAEVNAIPNEPQVEG